MPPKTLAALLQLLSTLVALALASPLDGLSLDTLQLYQRELTLLLDEVQQRVLAKRMGGAANYIFKREVTESESAMATADVEPSLAYNGTDFNSTSPEPFEDYTNSTDILLADLASTVAITDSVTTAATEEPTTSSASTTTPSPPTTSATFAPKTKPKTSNKMKEGPEDCIQLTQDQLVQELKQRGTYNPDFMAWDVPGVIRFLEKTTTGDYDHDEKKRADQSAAVERNLFALERILRELNVQCDLRSQQVISRLYNLTSPTARQHPDSALDDFGPSVRRRRSAAFSLLDLYAAQSKRDEPLAADDHDGASQLVGQVHVVPFGCDKRGSEEDGYLRLCGACQAIRRLPDTYFPPFINEVLCDDDKACLYFYNHPHGSCKQRHMNFVVLRNMGTPECQAWTKFNLNVRVSCECFVDEMSFFAKYV